MAEADAPPTSADGAEAIEQMVRYAEDFRRARGSQRALGRRLASSATPRERILVVDDSASIRLLVVATLGTDTYEILEAARGTEAMILASAKRPSLIILDVRMPDLDGIEVCRRVRADPALKATPIIMVTSATDDAARRAGLEAGADCYLTKPFSPAELLDAVDQLLRRSGSGGDSPEAP